MYRNIALFALAVAAAAPSTGFAAELVSNGSFETGSFSGWSQFGNTGFTGVATDPVSANTGSSFAFFGPVGSIGGISQVLSTVAGQQYSLSFALRGFGDSNSSFLASFDGNSVLSLGNPNTGSGYQIFNALVTATTSSTLLSFSFRDDPGFIYLDSVSVATNDSAVPEPSTWAMMLVGFGAIGFAMRRKQRQTVQLNFA